MNKVASYLQQHINGEVLYSDSVRERFSTDASILSIKPNLVIYPQNTNDIRKTARFAWQLAEKGHTLPITARGSGTDLTGSAIGSGMVMVFPAHLDKILEIDTKQRLVRLQPGVNFKSLQETLHTHGLFLPPYPASYQYSTVGGAIGNNTAGEKSIKYGTMRNWVKQLEVVLANGEVIETGRISKKEVNKKKGLPTLEGEIYRAVDGLLTDNAELAGLAGSLNVSKNNIGYFLGSVRNKDGSVDLTPLFVGSQGTLGVISEAIIKVTPYSPRTTLVVAVFDSMDAAVDAVGALRALQPSGLEMVDDKLLELANQAQGASLLQKVLGPDAGAAKLVLFAEFDDENSRTRNKKAKRAIKILQSTASFVVASDKYEEQQKLMSIRDASSLAVNWEQNGKVAVPAIDDAIVPFEMLHQFMNAAYELLDRHRLDAAIWGHVGEANLHVMPLMDLRKLSDRQKLFKVMDEYYRLVIEMGGSIAAEHNDGRLRAPFVATQYGGEMVKLYEELKRSFDPYGVLNPGVKVGTTIKDLTDMLRKDYTLADFADYIPKT